MAAAGMPRGFYFSPEPEDMVCNYLHRLVAGEHMPDTEGVIFHADVYGACPDELTQLYPPGSVVDYEATWFFFSATRLQRAGSKRADRSVAGGGYWRIEQSRTKVLVGGAHVGTKSCLGFYRGKVREEKSAWLMEEYSSVHHDGAGGTTMPVLCTVYVSPCATEAQRKDAIARGAPIELDPKTKIPRVVVSRECFGAVAAMLPPSSVRTPAAAAGEPAAPWHHQIQYLQAAPPPEPADLGHIEIQSSQTAPPPPAILGQHQIQFLQAARHAATATLQIVAPPPPVEDYAAHGDDQLDAFVVSMDGFLPAELGAPPLADPEGIEHMYVEEQGGAAASYALPPPPEAPEPTGTGEDGGDVTWDELYKMLFDDDEDGGSSAGQ